MMKTMTSSLPALVDLKKLEKKYKDHTSKCEEIAKEVNKWGKVQQTKLNFLKSNR